MEPTNQDSQVSDSSQIHGITLKYSDDEVTDEEMRGLNLQTTAHQYMMESDAQHQTTPISFQKSPLLWEPVSPCECYIPDGQNTWLSQIVHWQPAQPPDESQGIRLQIPFLGRILWHNMDIWFVMIHRGCMLFMTLYLQRSPILLNYNCLIL